MNIGKLDRIIVVEKPTREPDSYGDINNEVTWETYCRLRANRSMTRGDEAERVGKITSNSSYDYFARYRNEIDTSMRIYDLDDKKYYSIVAVDPLNRRSMLKIRVTIAE